MGISVSYESIKGITSELRRTGGEFVFLRLFSEQFGPIPPLYVFLLSFGPLIAFILTFDSINREHSTGTLGMVLSQPVNRDSLINGKYLAGAVTIILTLSGVFILVLGIGITFFMALPTIEELFRIITFLGISIIYMCLWVSLGILFSIMFRREGTSALASISVWLFFILFIYIASDFAAQIGIDSYTFMLISPSYLYTQVSTLLLDPHTRIVSPVSYEKIVGMLNNPLPFNQSLLLTWPYVTGLCAITLIIFIISYVIFMKQEIRPP